MNDLISRQAAIDAINRAVTKEVARWSVKELPSAEVKPVKRGKWIRERRPCIFSQTGSADWLTCSVCGERFSTTEVNKEKYCRNCGAKMKGEDDEID